MLVFLILFSLMASSSLGKVASLDLCSDAWILENFSEEEIGGMTFLGRDLQETMLQKPPLHRGTTEEILVLNPQSVVSEFPLCPRRKRIFEEKGIRLHLLPRLLRLKDLKKRFPWSRLPSFPSIGRGRVVFFVTNNLHSPGSCTFWGDVLECLGFINGTATLGHEGWHYLSAEHILSMNPSFLIVLGEGISLPPCLDKFQRHSLSSVDSLCPSPQGVHRLVEKLEKIQ